MTGCYKDMVRRTALNNFAKEDFMLAHAENKKAGEYVFEDAMTRIRGAVGAITQKDLCKVFGISQPSIHYAMARQSIPATWLLKIVGWGVNPDWILYGDPYKPYLCQSDAVPDTGPASTTAEAVLKLSSPQTKGGEVMAVRDATDTPPVIKVAINIATEPGETETKEEDRFQSI